MLSGLASAAGTSVLFGLGAATPAIIAEQGVSFGLAGLLSTSTLLVHSAVQVPASRLAASKDPRPLLAGSIIYLVLLIVVSMVPMPFGLLLAVRALMGLGTGSVFLLATVYVVSAVAVASNRLRQGIVGGSGLFGVALTNLAAPAAMAVWGWRGAYATGVALLLLLLGLLLAFRIRVAPASSARLGFRDLIRPLARRNAWALGLAHTAGFGTFSVLASWLVGYLAAALHLASSTSNYLASAIIFMGGLARVLSGAVTWNMEPKALVAVSLGISASALLAESFGPPLLLSTLLILTALWFSAYSYSSIFALSFQADPPEELGATTGAFNFIASMAAATMPYLFGLAIDLSGHYRGGFGLMATVGLLGTASIGLFRQYRAG